MSSPRNDQKLFFIYRPTKIMYLKAPRLYRLPKIHKPGNPLRPKVKAIDFPSYGLTKYFAKYLKSFSGKSASYDFNYQHFVKRLKTLTIRTSDLLISISNPCSQAVLSPFCKLSSKSLFNTVTPRKLLV